MRAFHRNKKLLQDKIWPISIKIENIILTMENRREQTPIRLSIDAENKTGCIFHGHGRKAMFS
jgi:hypothetical protein